MGFVLDSSVTMAWVFPDEQSTAALAMRDRLLTETAVVPAVWPFEVTNVLALGERRGRISPGDADQFLVTLQKLPIVLDTARPLALPESLLVLARSSGLSAYDAAYLELAQRLGLPLATQDKRLRQVANQIGVSLII